MGFSLGIGLTNECNLNCAHCYRSTDHIERLSLDDIRTICDCLRVESVGMGTGENALHPEFLQIVAYFRDRGIRLTMASNGYSLNTIPGDCLTSFHDVEVSIDFPTALEQDAFRGEGNWLDVHRAVERCRNHDIPVSILTTLMSINYDKVHLMTGLARSLGASLRVNAYQSVKTDAFRLSYEQFWEGYKRLFDHSQLVSCSEPVVRAALGYDEVSSPCGHRSIRVTPGGRVIPCVYWPGHTLDISDLVVMRESVFDSSDFKRASMIPQSAADCSCQGGCASRRALSGNLDKHDDYCPWSKGKRINITADTAPGKALLRASNVCTTIVA